MPKRQRTARARTPIGAAAGGDGLTCAECRSQLKPGEGALRAFASGYEGLVCPRCARRTGKRGKAGTR
jgi:hypothetical protein